jgi:YVTN family beta-propeller protein
MRSRARDHALATVMFTDIVGSTKVAAELGDRRWRALVSRHHAIVRSELKRFHGREIDTAGDGFYCTFEDPADAIRCACAIADDVRELGIEIRSGLTFGETELIEGKPGGITVHAASRITSLAGPGEVLVSATVRELVPGSGFEFEDRGTHELRDVPGEVRLFAVIAVDGSPRQPALPPDEALARREVIRVVPFQRRRGGRAAIIAAATILLAALIAIPMMARRGSGATGAAAPSTPSATTSTGRTDRAMEIDPITGRATASFAAGSLPSAVAYGEGSVWVTNANDGTVSRIDPASGRTTTIRTGTLPRSVAVGGGYAWVGNDTSGTVTRIDAATNRTETVDLGIGVGAHSLQLAFDDTTGSVWVAIGSTSLGIAHPPVEVGRIDPVTRTYQWVDRIDCTCFRTALTGGGGSIWWATDDGHVVRIDARSSRIVWQRWIRSMSFYTAGMGHGVVWLGSATQWAYGDIGKSGGAIVPLDAATDVLGDPVSVGGGPTGIVVTDRGVFVGDIRGAVHHYITGSVVADIPIDGQVTGIAASEGALWISVNSRPLRIPAGQ